MEQVTVTAQDRENAERRQEIALAQNTEFAVCQTLALRGLGTGWSPWMKLSLVESDYHRQTGSLVVRATAYKVCRGDSRHSADSLYFMEKDGAVVIAETPDELFGDILKEKHPTYGFERGGQWIPFDRWCVTWSALELYHPRSAEELATARVNRERKKAERDMKQWQANHPLFADLPASEM